MIYLKKICLDTLSQIFTNFITYVALIKIIIYIIKTLVFKKMKWFSIFNNYKVYSTSILIIIVNYSSVKIKIYYFSSLDKTVKFNVSCWKFQGLVKILVLLETFRQMFHQRNWHANKKYCYINCWTVTCQNVGKEMNMFTNPWNYSTIILGYLRNKNKKYWIFSIDIIAERLIQLIPAAVAFWANSSDAKTG